MALGIKFVCSQASYETFGPVSYNLLGVADMKHPETFPAAMGIKIIQQGDSKGHTSIELLRSDESLGKISRGGSSSISMENTGDQVVSYDDFLKPPSWIKYNPVSGEEGVLVFKTSGKMGPVVLIDTSNFGTYEVSVTGNGLIEIRVPWLCYTQ